MYKMNEKDGGDGKEVEKRKRRSDLLHFLFLFDVVSCVLSHSISSAPVAAWCVFDVTLCLSCCRRAIARTGFSSSSSIESVDSESFLSFFFVLFLVDNAIVSSLSLEVQRRSSNF